MVLLLYTVAHGTETFDLTDEAQGNTPQKIMRSCLQILWQATGNKGRLIARVLDLFSFTLHGRRFFKHTSLQALSKRSLEL